MDISQKILSNITVYMKYAKYSPELNRRETWKETVDRYFSFMLNNLKENFVKFAIENLMEKNCLKVR